MAVNRACYCSRLDVMTATDIQLSVDYIRHVDSAIEAAADEADRLTKRRFWNEIRTNKWDWPNYQRAYPWRLWFDAAELADVTSLVPTVTTGGTPIPSSAIFWGPWNYAPPYTYMELDRSQSYAFGVGPTPQQDIQVLGNFGYWTKTKPGGALAAAVSSTTATTVTVSDSSKSGVGDVITVDGESMLVSDNAMSDTGQAQTGMGCSTASDADNELEVSNGSQISAGELLALDAEWMLALSVTGNYVTVDRAYGGTVLAAHSGAEVYAPRALTVVRAFGGTTAATHSNAAPVSVALIPPEIREYAIAEAQNYVFQKTTGYARTIGENGAQPVPGGSLPDLRARVQERYARQARQRVV
jgi:hypothetical protein